MKTTKLKNLVSIKEYAKTYKGKGCSETYIYRLIRKGKIKPVMINEIKLIDITTV